MPMGVALGRSVAPFDIADDGRVPGTFGFTAPIYSASANAVIGVTQGFKKELEIVGLGYRASVAGDKLTMTLGFAHPVVFKLPAGIKVTIDPKMTILTLTGTDAYLVGETAAQIRQIKKPEPYKGSGIKYVGEHIIRKAGKAAAGAAGATAGGGAKK